MDKIFIVLAIFVSSIFALNEEYQFDATEIQILKSFDIDESFLSDPILDKMKSSLETHQKERFLERLNNANILIPLLKDKINEAGIPSAFLYLAMAESNFSLKAYSNKRAVGLWQFMPQTAKRYNLTVDLYVDERRDILKSTDAAIAYLKGLYEYYDKWYLAILSYNCGEGRVMEGIIRASIDKYIAQHPTKKNSNEVKRLRNTLAQVKKGRVYIKSALQEVEKLDIDIELSDLLKVQKNVKRQYLPKESRYYIRKIVAYASMANKYQYLNNGDSSYILNRGHASPLITVPLSGGVHLGEIASFIGMPLKELMEYNRHLNYKLTPTYAKEYNIYIPYDRLAFFKESYKEGNSDKKYLIHKVAKGDNLGFIGKKYGIDYKIIKSYNNLTTNMLSLNQKLIIPIFVGKSGQKSIHTVRRGDTIGSISKQYQTTIDRLVRDNSLSNNGLIKIGDKLVIN